MITGVLKIDQDVGEDINLEITDYFYTWFIIETIKSIVIGKGNYDNLTRYYDAGDLECSSVTFIDVFIEQLMEMYYSCHNTSLKTSEELLEDETIMDSVTLNQCLGDLHYQTFTSLVTNNSYQEFLNIVDGIGIDNSVSNYSAVVNQYGNTLQYVIKVDATAQLLNSLIPCLN